MVVAVLLFEGASEREKGFSRSRHSANGHEVDVGVLNGVQDVSFVRLVFTPSHKTIPTVLVVANLTSNHTSYEYGNEPWIGDANSRDWKSSISLEAAHDIFSRVNGTRFTNFVWRQMVYRCVFEPVFVFTRPAGQQGGARVFVGSHAARACLSISSC